MSAEHVSYLRLERHRLGELSARETRAVVEHLAGCALCRACLAEVEQEVALPELPVVAGSRERAPAADLVGLAELRAARERARLRKRLLLGSQVTGALALAAAALLMLRPLMPQGREAFDAAPAARIGVKGGDVAIELVRKRGEAIDSDADVFAEGDAFKVLLTCPPPLSPRFDVVVYQAGQAYFPLHAGTLERCGNRLTLEGAFSIDGPHDALVCVALGERDVPARSALRRGPAALPELSVCARLTARK